MDAVADQRHEDQHPDNAGEPQRGHAPAEGTTQAEQPQGAYPAGTAPAPHSEAPRTEAGSGSPDSPAGEQATPPAGSNVPAPAPAGPNPAQDPDMQLDPEQLRLFQEFQQFQRFQEFQRAKEAGLIPPPGQQPQSATSGELQPAPSRQVQRATPGQMQPATSREVVPPHAEQPQDAPPGRRKPPRWLVSLGGKIVGALLMLAAIVIGAALAINYFLGPDDPITPAEQAQRNREVPIEQEGPHWAGDPYEAVRRIYHDIAQGDVEYACLRFAQGSDKAFAAGMGYPTCEDAVRNISKEVRSVNGANSYAESIPSSTPGERYKEVSSTKPGESVTIDSCEAAYQTGGIQGGPALGTFTVTRLPQAYGEQWSITGYEPGPRKCPKKP